MNIRNNSFQLAISIIFLLFSTTSCKKTEEVTPDPIANFTYLIVGNFAPARINFVDESERAVSYRWDFGDGKSSTQKSPSHIFEKGGVYTVELAVTNDGGTVKKTTTVNIEKRPTKIKIKELKLINIPFVDSSANSWDADCDQTGPDVYIFISDNSAYFESDNYYSNVTESNLPLKFSRNTGEIDMPLLLSDLNSEYTIAIYDYDTHVSGCGNDDFLGGYYYTPKDYIPINGYKYPTTLKFKSSNSSIKVEFDLEVEWQK